MKKTKKICIGLFSAFIILAAGIPLASFLYAESLPVVVHINNVKGTETEKTLELKGGVDTEFQLDVEIDEGYEVTGIALKNYDPDVLANINGSFLIQVLNTGEQTYIIKSKRTSDGTVMPEVNLALKVTGIRFNRANHYYKVGDFSRNFINLSKFDPYEELTFEVEDETVAIVHKEDTFNLVEGLKEGTTKITATNAKGEKAVTTVAFTDSVFPESDVKYHAYYSSFPVNHPLNQKDTIVGSISPLDTFSFLGITEDSGNPELGVFDRVPGTDKIAINKALAEGTYRYTITPTYSDAMKGPITIQGELIVEAASDEIPTRSWVEYSDSIPSSGWFQTKPTIRLSQVAKDLGYEKIVVNDVSQPEYVVSEDGKQTIAMKFEKTDGTINVSSIKMTLLVDSVAPSVPVLTKEKNGTITMRASDPIGGSDIYAYHYVITDMVEDKELVDSKGTYFTEGAYNYLIPSSIPTEKLATTEISVYASDRAGNQSSVVKETLDKFKSVVPKETPTVDWIKFDKVKNANGWYNEKPSISISSTASALGYTKIAVDNGVDKTSYTITADGKKTYAIVFKKADATESNVLNVEVKVDTTAPVIRSVELIDGENGSDKQLHILSEDTTSGIQQLTYRIEDLEGIILTPETIVNTPPEEGIKIPAPMNKKFIVFVKAMDMAGKESLEKEQSLSTEAADLIKDTPTTDWLTSSDIPVNGWYTTAPVLSISQKASNLGYTKFGVTAMNPTLTITTEGESKLTLTFEKADGVQSNTLEYSVKLDTKSPIVDEIVLEPTTSLVDAAMYRMTFAKAGSDKQIHITADDGALGSGVVSIVSTIRDNDLGVDLIKDDKVDHDEALYQIGDDKEVKVCSKAIDHAGRTGDEVCKTVSTKVGGVSKSEKIKNNDTGIVLKANDPVFEENDALQISNLSSSDTVVKELLKQQDTMLFEKGVQLSWVRGVSKQEVQTGMKLEIPSAWIKGNQVFVEMKDGTFKKVNISGTSAVADIDTIARVVLLKQVIETPEDEQTELKDKTSGFVLKLSQGAFKANTTLHVSDVTKSIEPSALQTISKKCLETQEIDKIYKLEVSADDEKYTPQARMNVQIPAKTAAKASFLIPSGTGYESKEVDAKDGFYDIETTSLGYFSLMKTKEVANPNPEDKTPPTEEKEPTGEYETSVKGANTSDSTNLILWTLAVIGTLSMVVLLVKSKRQDSIE